MLHYWLLVALSWFGSVSPQFINTAGPGAVTYFEPLETGMQHALPQASHYNLPEAQLDESLGVEYSQFYRREDGEQELEDKLRRRRTVYNINHPNSDEKQVTEPHWLPNLVDTDKTTYERIDSGSPNIKQGMPEIVEANGTAPNVISDCAEKEKRSFSPWGGKRDGRSIFEHMYTWRRPESVKEPSMPKSTKRVRFSPWGGKRGSPLILRPPGRGSRVVLSSNPLISRLLAGHAVNGGLNLAGFQLIQTSSDKRHPIGILALTSQLDDKSKREALPFRALIESMPKLFKPGHPYSDVNLKKDGKRKVKFSTWGGKRAPPIIGPIWTPTSLDEKDDTIDALLLVQDNAQDKLLPRTTEDQL